MNNQPYDKVEQVLSLLDASIANTTSEQITGTCMTQIVFFGSASLGIERVIEWFYDEQDLINKNIL
jgi:hypothetical protein